MLCKVTCSDVFQANTVIKRLENVSGTTASSSSITQWANMGSFNNKYMEDIPVLVHFNDLGYLYHSTIKF